MQHFDILVVGGGHAGVEAAAAAARMGARSALLTFDRQGIGAMSCNPAIGGLGKGHLVREVDALDGIIARAADAAAIHYRMLNSSKGAAVQGPRIQADRRHFRAAVRTAVAAQPLLTLVEGEASGLSLHGGRVRGAELADGRFVSADAVILATGTFLGGRLFRGDERMEGGRIRERAATRLGIQLRSLGLPLGRLKTGTPPRLDGRSIDWARVERQASDGLDWTMSVMSGRRSLPELACAITRTNSATHAVIADAFHRSPLYSGDIEGRGPRYCPSIEDKVRRFGDRDGHQIFLEPEGLDTHLVYPNGVSTSLPPEVQLAFLRSIAALEHVILVEPGYAVEYDHVDPRALDHGLQLRAVPGLFCAGQINGTTGYEEAAAQGLVAGIAAARHVKGEDPPRWARGDSYIGVMIDDLTLQGITEPYRMLTARAEYRLRLRADNAEARLGETGLALGCVGEDRARAMDLRRRWRTEGSAAMATRRRPAEWGGDEAQPAATVGEWVRREQLATAELMRMPPFDAMPEALVAELVEDARYEPYLQRQVREQAKLAAEGKAVLPPALDYAAVPGLSGEMVERLTAARPATLAEAGRIRGITPAALAAILVHGQRRA